MPSGSSSVTPEPAAASPIRLLYIASTKSQGGIESHSVEIAQALGERGMSVEFACRPGGFVEKWCREAGLPTVPFYVRNSGDLGAALRLAQIICDSQSDLVHVHSRRDYVVAVLGTALARRLLRRPVALVLHAHMIRPLGSQARLTGRFFESGADAIAAVSGAVCDLLRHDHHFNPAFVHLIPNGVNLYDFATPGSLEAADQRAKARQNLTLPSDAIVLGMIGRLDAKGQRHLLSVVPDLMQHCPALKIVLVGSEGKPNEQAALTSLAQSGGFGERLIFTGPRADIPTLLPAFDVLLHLPLDEAFGLALAEAMAAGLPTIATNIGGCREVVRSTVTGLLVSPGDDAALTAALHWLVDPLCGEERRSDMGRAGRLAVESNFSQSLQIDRLLALYQAVCPGFDEHLPKDYANFSETRSHPHVPRR